MNDKIFLLFVLALVTGCSNRDAGARADDELRNLYFDYQVWAEEGSGTVTIRLQYKEGGNDGSAVALPGKKQVLLDAVPFQLDSTRFLGVYYELTKPLAELAGNHSISVTDEKGTVHRESFEFYPFELFEELPEELHRKPYVLRLKNLPTSPTPIRLVLTDTSLTSPGVNEEVRVQKGKLNITQAMLESLAAGPVTLELGREESRPMASGSGERGTLVINYQLRRQFLLVDRR